MNQPEDPIQVVHITDNLMLSALPGGVLRHINYARGLRSRGVEIHIVTGRSDVDDSWQEQKCVKVHTIPLPNDRTKSWMRAQLLRAAYELASKWPAGKVVVFSDGAGVSLGMMLQVCRAILVGIPTMLNSGMIPDAPPDNWLAAMRRKLGMQLFLRCHTFVILQTLATKELYSSCYGRLNDRVEVIGNGVDCRRFAPLNPRVRSQVRQLLGVSENALLVICVASVIPRKGTHLLLSAWRYVLERFPDAHLAVIGTVGRRATFHGDTAFLDAYADEIRTQISTLPCPASVVLWGQQVDNVESFLGSSDVFAFTSYQEGMPNAVLEAMASGLPCVLSAYRGFPANGDEFGVDGTHFIKASHDPTSIAASIIELLSSSERRASIGKAARNWMIETQDHPIILQRWATIIKRAISGWRGASLKRRSQDVVAAEP